MIVYASRTGNVRNIVKRLGLPSSEIHESLVITKPYILITYTDGLGDTPSRVESFLEAKENQDNLKGIVTSGNTNFGMNFCLPADTISNKYNVPIVRKIDLRGIQDDIDIIKEFYKKHIGCE